MPDNESFEPGGGGGVPPTRTITAGTGLSGGGDLSANRTVALANTAVTPASYTNLSATVDAQGRITNASSGAAGVPATRQVATSTGLQGGGDLSADRTLSLATAGAGSATYATPASVTVDAYGRVTSASAGALQQLVQQVPGLFLYLDARCWATTDGQALPNASAVPDLSGRSNSLTVTGSGVTWNASAINGLPAFGFDGASYLLGGALIAPGDSQVGVLAVVKPTSLSSNPEIIEIGAGHFVSLQAYQFAILATGEVYCANFGASNERFTAAGAITAGAAYLIGWQVSAGAFGPANPSFSVGGAAAPSAQGTGSSVPSISPLLARVGANLSASPAQFLTGSLAALVAWNGPTPPNLAAITALMKSTWGV